jgi:hypothetical protein
MKYADPRVAMLQHSSCMKRRHIRAAQGAQRMSRLTQIRRMAGKAI